MNLALNICLIPINLTVADNKSAFLAVFDKPDFCSQFRVGEMLYLCEIIEF
jgi:hypothetical protein